MTALVYEFDVGVSTHDRLRRGETVTQWRRVVVATDRGFVDAELLACQLVGCDDVVVTESRWRW